MKRISHEQYCKGIASFVAYSELLGQVLRETLPGVKIKSISAYHWRGYQIIKCPGLADYQYFCLFYFSNPKVLLFKEYFEMENYPFQIEIDLQTHGFFMSTYEQQKQILTDFIKQSVSEAIRWNQSDLRHKLVPERRW